MFEINISPERSQVLLLQYWKKPYKIIYPICKLSSHYCLSQSLSDRCLFKGLVKLNRMFNNGFLFATSESVFLKTISTKSFQHTLGFEEIYRKSSKIRKVQNKCLLRDLLFIWKQTNWIFNTEQSIDQKMNYQLLWIPLQK